MLVRSAERVIATRLLTRGYGRAFFWDGRAVSREEQVLQPIQSPSEMDMTLAVMRARVGLDERTIALARRLRPQRAIRGLALDRYAAGESGALSTLEKAGLQVFRVKGNCTACHVGPTITDERFHHTGVAWRDGRMVDEGRGAVTSIDADRGAFKTPTLREIARTAPSVHDGSLPTLEAVVDFYDQGGRIPTSIRRCARGGLRQRRGSRSSRFCGRCRARFVRGGRSCRHGILAPWLRQAEQIL